jgi:hypothetical protein
MKKFGQTVRNFSKSTAPTKSKRKSETFNGSSLGVLSGVLDVYKGLKIDPTTLPSSEKEFS